MDTAEDPADPADLRGPPVTPIPLQAAPSAVGRSPVRACWSPTQVPLTEDTAARQASTDVTSGEGPGHLQTLGSRRPGQPSWQPQEPVPRSPPPPKDCSVSGPTPQGARSQVPSVQRVKRRPSVFSTSKQGQRSRHADAEDGAGSGRAAASLPLDVKLT